MGVAAYAKDPRPFEEDHALRRQAAKLESRIERALSRIRLLSEEKTLERKRSARILEEIERTYLEARAAGLTAESRELYWLTLIRIRANAVDPTALEG